MTKKEAKKVKKNKNVIGNTSSNDDVTKIIKIICAVVILFAIVYFATAIINGELFGKKEEEKEVEIQKVEILMGETFEKKDNEYMVIYYDFEDKIYSNLYAMMLDNYNSSNKDIPMYKVDLSTNFSKKYMATGDETSNTKPTGLSNLKIKGATLIRIKDKKVVKYVEGKDNIKSYIDEILK